MRVNTLDNNFRKGLSSESDKSNQSRNDNGAVTVVGGFIPLRPLVDTRGSDSAVTA